MNSTPDPRIVEKVRALLALAGNNPNEFEAASAAAKAAELMARHNIARLEAEQYRTPEAARFERRYKDVVFQRHWPRALANIVAKAYSCLCTYAPGGKRVTFYGRPDNLEVVEYTYAYLERAVLRAVDDAWYRMPDFERRRHRPQSWRTNFCDGAVTAIYSTLQREAPVVSSSSTALVVREQKDLEAFRGKVSSGDRRRVGGDGYGAGHAAGKNISVRPAMPAGAGAGPRRLGDGS